MTDTQGRPMVPTYGTKGTRRYCYYETRKDLARPDDAPATRLQRGLLERHLTVQLADLLTDENALRHQTGIEDAAQLRELFERGRLLAAELQHASQTHQALRAILIEVRFNAKDLELTLRGEALLHTLPDLRIRTPLPARRPFREARLRIDSIDEGKSPDPQLVKLLAEAREVQRLIFASPELSLNALGKREGRCQTQLGRLLRLSWLSPRVVEAILSGEQPKGISRRSLLNDDLPIAWDDQERMLGLIG